MRLLGGLGLVAPVAFAAVFVAMPEALDSWVDGGTRSIVAAVAAGTIGVSLTAMLFLVYVPFRLRRLVKAAEQIAAGQLAVSVRAAKRGRSFESRLARAINTISASLAETTDAATNDKLTGISNRRTLLVELFNEVERANRYERPLSVAFVDIDHFKAVNDSYGHAAGDIVLRGVAQALEKNLRATDMVGRYGGEEFMLILTETNVEEGALLTEKMRAIVSRERFAIEGGQEISVTISIGIAGGVGSRLTSDALVRDADAAMYSAKSLGRDQTYIFAEPDEDARVPRAPISAAGRTRAIAIGQAAKDAATASLTSVISPLPHYRGQPSALIASIVVAMAKNLDLPPAEVDRIRTAALLHDVGKVAVPQEILDKPAALTSAEWRTVVQHPRIGQVILEQAAALKDAVPIILHHHERFSGHGYPFGLRGNEIPLGARIVSIADAYDAMTHDRPYKRAMSHDNAIKELRRHAGTQFDPELVALFCDLFARHAPVPDPKILAMTVPLLALGESHGADVEAAPAAKAPPRRRRKSDHADAGEAGVAMSSIPLAPPEGGGGFPTLPKGPSSDEAAAG
ncbi:MAG TPA: diguanylate cyclase [Candidatus Limnocylindrales bacterium]|jgi:diguanylate cyclase (GGDEF)-like protein|nr:diguanylate cyclase [Candidatus Limnocylindrales bacterium]